MGNAITILDAKKIKSNIKEKKIMNVKCKRFSIFDKNDDRQFT